jgi:hypothetical protein
MDFKKTIKDPYRNKEEFLEWIKHFSINEQSVQFICDLLKKVSYENAYDKFTSAILDSETIKHNIEKFLEMIQNCVDNFYIKRMKGLLLAKYDLKTLTEIKKEDKAIKFGFLIESIKKEELTVDSEEEIKELWELQDQEIMPSLIRHVIQWIKQYDLNNLLLLSINDRYVKLLLMDMSFYDVQIDGKEMIPFLTKAISLNQETADAVWHFLYYTDLYDGALEELCIQTLEKYKPSDIGNFNWCITEKIKVNPHLVTIIVDNMSGFDYLDQWNLWEALTMGNPEKTVEESKKIINGYDGSEGIFEELGKNFDVIKATLYEYGDKESCIKLYCILRDWLKEIDFSPLEEISDEDLNKIEKDELLYKISEITTQLFYFDPHYDINSLLDTLEKYPKINELLKERIVQFLDNKKFHPILDKLRSASNPCDRAFLGATEVLNKLEFYFNNFPLIENQLYMNNNELIEKKVDQLFENLSTFLSEVLIFERLYNGGVIKVCEPQIGDKHPDFLVEINGKKIVIEVTKLNEPLKARITGVGGGGEIERKTFNDIQKKLLQTVPKDAELPVILICDISEFPILGNIIEEILHGSYALVISDDTDLSFSTRKDDYISQKKELACFIQAVIIFRPDLDDKRLILKGGIIKHKYRDDLINESELEEMHTILFNF